MPAEMLSTVTYFAILLGFGVLVTNLTRKIRIPNTFFMLIVGLIFGPMVLGFVDVGKMGDVPLFLRTLALIVIVFTGAFHLKFTTFKKVSNTALKLSVLGFFFSTIVLGLAAHLIFSLSLTGSFILGSIVAGTSTAVVITLKDALGEENEIMHVLTVESLFNSPLSVLVPMLFLDLYLAKVEFSTIFYLSQFWQLIAAGVGTGIVIGFVAGKLFLMMEREMTPILSFAIALLTYAFASNVGGSGILAVAICGLILGNMYIPYRKLVTLFEDSMSIMLTISIFTLLGAQIAFSLSGLLFIKEAVFILLLVLFSRPIFVIICLANEARPLRDILLLSFAGPRGEAAAAMAAIPLTYIMSEGVTSLVVEGQIILLTTFLVVLTTVLIGTIASVIYSRLYPVTEKKKMQKPPVQPPQVQPGAPPTPRFQKP